MKTTRILLLAVVCSLMPIAAGRGEALPDGGAAHFIQQLDAPEFARRQEASRKLTEAGSAAFPDIEKAAAAGTREVASRAVEVLRSHYQAGDDATKQAARAALARLAAGTNRAAAQRANEALNPQPKPSLEGANLNGGVDARIRLLRLQAMQRQGLPIQQGVARRTHIRTTNGQVEIEVQDGEKVMKIKDVAGGLEGEITTKLNGRQTTRKVAAKDFQELKQKDAELAQAYEGLIKQQIETYDRMIKDYKVRQANFPNLQRAIDSLEKTRQQFEERLQDPPQQAKAPQPVAPAPENPFAPPAAPTRNPFGG